MRAQITGFARRAPSVMGPERFREHRVLHLPLRWNGFRRSLSRDAFLTAVLLPESFRGGCSFGAGLINLGPISPAGEADAYMAS